MAHQSAAMARTVTAAQALDVALSEMDGPLRWGVADCCASACIGFERLWGVNVWRHVPRYETAAQAARLIVRHGGAEAWCGALARAAGLRASKPHPGALGLFIWGDLPITLGLCVGDRWAIRHAQGGVSLRRVDPAAAWGVRHG